MNRKRIVVATDLSPKSDIAIEKAMELAVHYDKWLEILHVINPSVIKVTWGNEKLHSPEEIEENRIKREKEISDKIASRLHRTSNKLNIHTRVGDSADEILAFAKEQHATAIILPDTYDADGHALERFFLGTTVRQVVEESHLPTLVVKSDARAEYKKVLIPVDYSDEAKKAVEYTSGLFPDAELYLFHITEVQTDFKLKFYGLDESEIEEVANAGRSQDKNLMHAFIDKLDVKNTIKEVHVEGLLAPETILEEAEKLGVDLISVYAYDINNLRSKLLGSVSSGVLEMAKVDVLMFHDN